jgi:hypothetical protein
MEHFYKWENFNILVWCNIQDVSSMKNIRCRNVCTLSSVFKIYSYIFVCIDVTYFWNGTENICQCWLPPSRRYGYWRKKVRGRLTTANSCTFWIVNCVNTLSIFKRGCQLVAGPYTEVLNGVCPRQALLSFQFCLRQFSL